MNLSHHRHAHGRWPHRPTLAGAALGVTVCAGLHLGAYESNSELLVAVSARLFFLPVLYAAIKRGLVEGFCAGLMAALGLTATMTFHGLQTAHIEHYADIPFQIVAGVLVGAYRDHLELEKRTANQTRDLFSRFVSPRAIDTILARGAALEGEETHAAVLFADIRGFTSISEQLSPRQTVSLLNDLFSEIVPIVFEHNGLVDKYMGDAVMAVFGVPVPAENASDLAVHAACEMLKRVETLRPAALPPGNRLRIGIGIHCGPVISGNIGSLERMDYTVIGDTVNAASRIQALTRELGTSLLISAEVLEGVSADTRAKLQVVEAGTHELRGKKQRLSLFACKT
jgi:class 3 adenylate cyclase